MLCPHCSQKWVSSTESLMKSSSLLQHWWFSMPSRKHPHSLIELWGTHSTRIYWAVPLCQVFRINVNRAHMVSALMKLGSRGSQHHTHNPTNQGLMASYDWLCERKCDMEWEWVMGRVVWKASPRKWWGEGRTFPERGNTNYKIYLIGGSVCLRNWTQGPHSWNGEGKHIPFEMRPQPWGGVKS